jgi:hypothetical protein
MTSVNTKQFAAKNQQITELMSNNSRSMIAKILFFEKLYYFHLEIKNIFIKYMLNAKC